MHGQGQRLLENKEKNPLPIKKVQSIQTICILSISAIKQ